MQGQSAPTCKRLARLGPINPHPRDPSVQKSRGIAATGLLSCRNIPGERPAGPGKGAAGRGGSAPAPPRNQSIALKFSATPSLIPENQRAVTVLVLV